MVHTSRNSPSGHLGGALSLPPATGPYLRLAYHDQPSAPDSILSNGSAPSESLTVASRPVSYNDDFSKGFYLRVIDGVSRLRGYRTSDEHLWSPHDRLIFREQQRGARCQKHLPVTAKLNDIALGVEDVPMGRHRNLKEPWGHHAAPVTNLLFRLLQVGNEKCRFDRRIFTSHRRHGDIDFACYCRRDWQ
jgi:hypothetical protein